jgi:hypothetical protein
VAKVANMEGEPDEPYKPEKREVTNLGGREPDERAKPEKSEGAHVSLRGRFKSWLRLGRTKAPS